MIGSWSHSRVVDFERCHQLAFLKYVKRIPELPRPLPPGKTEHANDRGTRVHTDCEMFVDGRSPVIPREAMKFEAEFSALRRLHGLNMVSLEGEWGYDRAWNAVPWRGRWELVLPGTMATLSAKKLPAYGREGDVVKVGKAVYAWTPTWLRMKLDALVFLSPYEAVAIDYKTGKKFGNEIKHGEQLMLYQLATFLRFPELETVHIELWYLDQDDLTHRQFTRAQGMRFKDAWDRRGNAITTAVDFPANPNMHSCKYCPYGAPEHGFPNGTGDCQVGRAR